jgi:hypothetical protein
MCNALWMVFVTDLHRNFPVDIDNVKKLYVFTKVVANIAEYFEQIGDCERNFIARVSFNSVGYEPRVDFPYVVMGI